MIKDITTGKIISKFDDDNKVYIINGEYLNSPNEKAFSDNKIIDDIYYYAPIKWRSKKCYILKEIIDDENDDEYFVYQMLIYHLGFEIDNGIIVDIIPVDMQYIDESQLSSEEKKTETCILTAVKNGIPISSYYIPNKDWEKNVIRILGIHDIYSESAKTKIISYKDYNKKNSRKFITYTADEKQITSISRLFDVILYHPFILSIFHYFKKINWDLLISLILLLGLFFYGYIANERLIEKQKLENKQKILLNKKKQIEQEILGLDINFNLNLNIEKIKYFINVTDNYKKIMFILTEESPLAIVRRVEKNEKILVISNYPFSLLKKLKENNFNYTIQRNMELSIELSKE